MNNYHLIKWWRRHFSQTRRSLMIATSLVISSAARNLLMKVTKRFSKWMPLALLPLSSTRNDIRFSRLENNICSSLTLTKNPSSFVTRPKEPSGNDNVRLVGQPLTNHSKSISVTIIFIMICSTALFSQGGKTGLAFLKLGVGGRSVAMGDIGAATSDAASAMQYNPANILLSDKSNIMLMHNSWIQDITREYLASTVPFDGWSMGFHLSTTSINNIDRREVPGEPIGQFDAKDFSLGISVAAHIIQHLSAGLSAKYLFEKIFVDESVGYAFDFGARYKFDETGFAAGITIANIGTMGDLRYASIKLPALMRFGVSYTAPIPSFDGHLNAEADGFTVFNEKKFHANIGIEADYQGTVFIRTGYQTGYDIKGFTAGIGAAYSLLKFDYGFTPFQNDFGSSHTVSLTIQL